MASYTFAVGVAVGVTGFVTAAAIGAWAMSEMKRQQTTVEPGHTPSRLVTTGPFRFSRNPLYLSLLFIAAGLAIAANSLWFALAALLLFLLLDRLVVRGEEAMIGRAFGDEYVRYRSHVRRWL